MKTKKITQEELKMIETALGETATILWRRFPNIRGTKHPAIEYEKLYYKISKINNSKNEK